MKADLREHTRRAKCLRWTVYVTSLIAIFFEYRLAVAAEPLELDTTFGQGGKVTENIADDGGTDAFIQPDGKIIVLGVTTKYPDVSTTTVALIRYNPGGTKDEGFGNLGVKTTLIGQWGTAWKVFLQPEGKILVVGQVGGDFALWRYTHSGETDESFGTGGQKVVPLGAYVSLANAALQTDGKIVLAGILDHDFVIARVLPNGELDPDFGKDGSGKVITDFGASDIPWAVAIQADHKIVVFGSSEDLETNVTRGVLARYNSNGTLDSSFNGGGMGYICHFFQSCGKIKVNLGPNNHGRVSIALLGSPRDALVATVKIAVAGAFGVARFNVDGSRDKNFGNDGIMDNPDNSGMAIRFLHDGRIAVSGRDIAGLGDFAVAIYESTGERCSSVTTDFGGGTWDPPGMVIQPDGKIVVVGYANNGTDLDFALARYNVAGCAPHKLWWGQYVASHIFVHPQDPPIGPSAPIPQLQIGRHEQFAIPASDGGAFAGPTRPGYQAFRLTNARGEDRQRGSMVAATNALGNSILEMLEAHRLLLPTDIAAERAGGAMGLGSRWAPLLKCYRVKMQSAGDTHRERKTFTLTDALGRTQNLELGEPESLCKPVDRRGRELIGPRTVSLVSYRVKDVRASGRASGGYARSVRLRATSEFVPPRVLQVEQPALLYLPSLAE